VQRAEGRGQERNLSKTKSEVSTHPASTVWERLSVMDVAFDYLQPRILNQVSFAEAELVRDKVRRLNLPGKHRVGAAFSRDICSGCCIRLSATRHIKSGVVCRSGSYPRQSQKIQLTRQAPCGSGFQPRYLHALHSCLPVLPEGSNVNAK
jgi:hypothetical protein